jgi:hypothetical protein
MKKIIKMEVDEHYSNNVAHVMINMKTAYASTFGGHGN